MSFDVRKVKVAIMRSYKFIRKNYICAIDGTGGIDIPVLSNYDKQLFRLSIFSAFSGKTRFFINLSAFSLSLIAAEGCTLRVFNVIDRSPAIKVRIVSDLGNLKTIIF